MKTSPVRPGWFSWLRRCFKWIGGGSNLFPRPKKTRKPRRCILFLESLEERAVPNGAPVAVDDGPFTVLHGQALNNIAILGNDSDPENDPLSVEIQQHPSHGYAYFDSYTGTAIYMSFLNYAGPDSLTYKLWDGQAYSNIATVTIEVTNNPPVAVDDGPFSVLHGQSITGIDLKANDSDADGDATTVEILASPSHGYLYQDYATGTWTYAASFNYAGPDSITYKLWDGQAYSNLATVSFNVTNTPPVGVDDGPFSVLHGQSITGIDLKANDSDADGDATTVEIVANPSHGYLYQDYATGTWTYTANDYHLGTDSFTYKVFDGVAYSSLATVTINIVNPYLDYLAAVAAADLTYAYTVLEAAAITQGIIEPARAEAEFDGDLAFANYLGTVTNAYQIYGGALATAEVVYHNSLENAAFVSTGFYNEAVSSFTAALDIALANHAAAMDAGGLTFQNSMAAAATTYDDYVTPYQEVRDQAYADYLANPEDPGLQATLNDAEAALAAAFDLAFAEWVVAYHNALANYESLAENANQVLEAALDDCFAVFLADLQAAEEFWTNAELTAWNVYLFDNLNAENNFTIWENGEWDFYTSYLVNLEVNLAATEAMAQSQLTAACAGALAAWQTGEEAAWNTYQAELANFPDPPPLGPRILEPSPVDLQPLPPFPGLAEQERFEFVALAQPERAQPNEEVESLNNLSLTIDNLFGWADTTLAAIRQKIQELDALIQGMNNALPGNLNGFNIAFRNYVTQKTVLTPLINRFMGIGEQIIGFAREAIGKANQDKFRIEGICSDMGRLGLRIGEISNLLQNQINQLISVQGQIPTGANDHHLEMGTLITGFQATIAALANQCNDAYSLWGNMPNIGAGPQTYLNQLYDQMALILEVAIPFLTMDVVDIGGNLNSYIANMLGQNGAINTGNQNWFANLMWAYEIDRGNLGLKIDSIVENANDFFGYGNTASQQFQNDRFRNKGLQNLNARLLSWLTQNLEIVQDQIIGMGAVLEALPNTWFWEELRVITALENLNDDLNTIGSAI